MQRCGIRSLGTRCQVFTKPQAKKLSPHNLATADMEEHNTTIPQAEYNGDAKREPSTPSVHSRDGSKDKEGGLNQGKPPAYTDVEGQQGEIHLSTAEDIVTQVIDLEDDPTMNPWTFRMFFLGTAFNATLDGLCFSNFT